MSNTEKLAYIVTGATGGIGRAIVDGLVRQGVEGTIILACRNAGKAQEVIDSYQADLVHIPLDLMSFDSVRSFFIRIEAEGYVVQTLFNNAGIMPSRLILSEDGHEAAMQTNFLSVVLLTKLLAGSMQCGSHIVLTTSLTRHLTRLREDWDEYSKAHQSRFLTYALSKRMLTHWGAQLARELEPHGIRVNLTDPGAVDTGMITMGNKVIDFLADHLARPLFSTPKQGAEPALLAGSTPLTGHIFSRRLFHTAVRPIPKRYSEFFSLLN